MSEKEDKKPQSILKGMSISSEEEERLLRQSGEMEAERLWDSVTKKGILDDELLLSSVKEQWNSINNHIVKSGFSERLAEKMSSQIARQKDLDSIKNTSARLFQTVIYLKNQRDQLPQVIQIPKIEKQSTQRKKVFISYSHRDSSYLNEIKRHFKPFLKGIDYWDDTRIQPGDKWKREIEKAISETKVAILLVSTDFFGSDFIETEELPPLLEAAEKDGAVILTLIVKPCLFEEFPLLNQYQAMNPPSRPVSKMDENEREELFVNLVRQTKKVLDAKPEDDE